MPEPYTTGRTEARVSRQLTAWAERQTTGNTTAAFLLREMAESADQHGIVRASNGQLAAAIESSTTTVVRKLALLESKSLIERHAAKDGNGGSVACVVLLRQRYDSLAELFEKLEKSGDHDRWYAARLREVLSDGGPAVRRGRQCDGGEVLSLDLDLAPEKVEDRQPTRRRDLSFEAMCEVCHCDPALNRGELNQALKKLRAAEPAMDDEALSAEIRFRASYLEQAWSDAGQVTPASLVRHWRAAAVRSEKAGRRLELVREALGRS